MTNTEKMFQALSGIDGVSFELVEINRIFFLSGGSSGMFVCRLNVNPADEAAVMGADQAIKKLITELREFCDAAETALGE